MNRQAGFALLTVAPLLALGLAAAADEAKIYECPDSKGQVVYQDAPCVEPVAAPATRPDSVSLSAPAKPPQKAAPVLDKKPANPPRRGTRPVSHPLASRPVDPPPFGRPVDARWATPAKTLQTFIDAVQAGDRALALSCLAGAALADLGPDPEAIPMEGLRRTVTSFTGYVSEGDLGPFWSIRALRAGFRPKWIFFERAASGEWKIAGI